jgi:hypothetical protein
MKKACSTETLVNTYTLRIVKFSRLQQKQEGRMLDVTHVCVTLSQLTQWQSDITGQYIGNKHKLDVASQSICAFQTAGSLPPLPAW